MITIPTVAMYNDDIAIYPDDQDCNLFYCIRTKPKIRFENGAPVFNGLFFTNVGTSGDADKDARLAGGIVSFDVHLGISDEEKKDITAYIRKCGFQQQVARRMEEEEKEKEDAKRAFIKETDMNFHTAGLNRNKTIGEVRIGAVNYTSGSVSILEQAGGDLVNWTSAGSPSLFGDNNCACHLTLSALGAELWYRALQGDSKPIAVQFNLKVPVRTPSLEVHAYVASFQRSETDRIVERTKESIDKGCSDVDVEHVDVKSITETFVENGLVVIDIRPSSASITSDCISQVRDAVMNILTKKIESIIATRFQGMTPKEREESMLEKLTQELRAFTEVRYTQEDVLEIPLNPNCNMVDFLSGLPDDVRGRCLKLIDMRDPLLRPKRVIHLIADAPWDFVRKVRVEAKCGDEIHDFLFNQESSKQDWQLGDTVDVLNPVRYTASVHFGNGKGYVLPEATANGDIYLNFGKIGLIDVTFKPHPNLMNLSGRNKVTSINVDLEYEDEDGNYVPYRFPLKLDDESAGEHFLRRIGKKIEKPLRYTVTYGFKSRESITTEPLYYYIQTEDNQVVYTPYPFKDSLNFSIDAPSIEDDTTIRKVTVELEYEDQKNDFSSSDYIMLTKEDKFETQSARLPVMDRSITDFKYRFIIEGGSSFQSRWIEGSADSGTTTIILPIQRYRIMCNLLKLGEDFSVGELIVTSTDGSIKKSFMLDERVAEKKMVEFFAQSAENLAMDFTYKLKLYDMTGMPVDSEGSWQGSVFMLPKPKIEESSC